MKHKSLEGNVNLIHGQKVVLIGSCFSNNLAPKFENSGFETLSNPLGTIFHPLALSKAIRSALTESKEDQIFQRDDIWFDWRASSTVYGMSHDEIQENIQLALDSLKASILTSHVLVVTFGTAWGYYLNSGQVVANCHKMPSETFEKRMSSLEELFQEWKKVLAEVKEMNPDLKVVFTISPVEHLKDGLVGNSRSKARLVELCGLLEEEGADYFHSYELVRSMFKEQQFYEADQLHLNAHAIELLWQQAVNYFVLPESIEVAQQIATTNATRTHKPIHPESKAAQDLKVKVGKTMDSLSKKHPGIYWK